MPDALTESFVKELRPPERGTATFWDDQVKGFGVRVFAPTTRNPEGSRSFFLNYRVDGVERRFTIGAYPTWGAKAARAEAKLLRQMVDRGGDPANERRARREAPTVHDLAERYRTEHLPRKAKRSQHDDWRMIETEILPRLAGRKVGEIHHGDIVALHRAITDRGAPVRANRVLAITSKMFALALKPAADEVAPWRDQAQGNPCRGVERNPEEGSERFFSSREVAAITDALQAHGNSPSADCLRLIMLTGCRPGEAMLATWEQFETEQGVWVKPSAHTKQRRIHRVPLGAGAQSLITRLGAERSDRRRTPFVFPGHKPGQPLKQLRSIWQWVSDYASVTLWMESTSKDISDVPMQLGKALDRRPKAAECLAEGKRRELDIGKALTDARIYDLRHTFASVGAGGGLSLQIVGKLLGHTQHRTTMRYAHLADDPLREAATKINTVIAGTPSAVAGRR